MRIIRVFPRKTNATPNDSLVRFGSPGLFDECDEVHVSVTWTYDLKKAEELVKQWQGVAPVKIGGPATGMKGEHFVAGQYIKPGYTITSRGCPNRCWFCSVWKREGSVRELPIVDGWNVLDDNLLACSENHIKAVFAMLQKQKHSCEFSGGWEAKRLQPWHIDLLSTIQLHQVWFAYDEDSDLEPLVVASRMLRDAGISYTKTGNVSHRIRCYCLVGFPGDTLDRADTRLRLAYTHGFLPMAMLWRNNKGEVDKGWRRFQKFWARPASINRMCRDVKQAFA
jgi:hypothetical protein